MAGPLGLLLFFSTLILWAGISFVVGLAAWRDERAYRVRVIPALRVALWEALRWPVELALETKRRWW